MLASIFFSNSFKKLGKTEQTFVDWEAVCRLSVELLEEFLLKLFQEFLLRLLVVYFLESSLRSYKLLKESLEELPEESQYKLLMESKE